MDGHSLILEPDVETVVSRSYPLKTVEGELPASTGSLPKLLQCLATPPMYTTLRVNTTNITTHAAKDIVEKQLKEQCIARGIANFKVDVHHSIPDCLVIHSTGPHAPKHQTEMEVIVDVSCGMAVLRGADVFKQGILGAPTAMQSSIPVQVFADLDGKCLRGATQIYKGKKLYVGNGVAQISREELFCADPATLRGVGIQMTEALYRAPALSDLLPSMVFAQNLPSIVCSHVLDPQPGQTVIDMCAAPGGKTCHIATLMRNEGRVVALDKTEKKVSKVKANAERIGLTCIETYAFDARKAVKDVADVGGGPPYPPNSFDAVLLDGPCSALGQRPSARNRMAVNFLSSFPKLQRALLSAAVSLLQPGGFLVYSTCTVTMEENEDQVAWVLKNYPELKLEKQTPHLGGFGLTHSSLSQDDCSLLQRFDPSQLTQDSEKCCDSDTIGFFIAKFRKLPC